MNRLKDIQKIQNYLKLIYKYPRNISRKFENDSSSWTGDITDNLISVRKLGNEQSDRHTRNLKLFETTIQTSQEYLKKNGSKSSSRIGVITDNLFSERKIGNEQTDRHTWNLKLFVTSVDTSQECLQKIWES